MRTIILTIISILSITCPLSNTDIILEQNRIAVASIIQEQETEVLPQSEIDLISQVVMAEAEGEPWEGKRYVIDTIFNRVDSPRFPNNIVDVIYQPWQFTSMKNGRYDRCAPNHELDEMIVEEYLNRSNDEVVFFTADQYGMYGTPSFSIANHYFSIQ